MNQEPLPQWVTIFERIGPGSAILIFTGAVLWKLLPALVSLVRAWRKQSEAVTAAVPKALEAIERIATNMERGFEKLNATVFGRRGDEADR